MSYIRAVAGFLLLGFMLLITRSGLAEPAHPTTTFVVHAPHAKSVAVIGNFNGWDGRRHMLAGPDAAGEWAGTFELAGDAAYFEFVFLIDGITRRTDSRYPTVADDFGSTNNIIVAP